MRIERGRKILRFRGNFLRVSGLGLLFDIYGIRHHRANGFLQEFWIGLWSRSSAGPMKRAPLVSSGNLNWAIGSTAGAPKVLLKPTASQLYVRNWGVDLGWDGMSRQVTYLLQKPYLAAL